MTIATERDAYLAGKAFDASVLGPVPEDFHFWPGEMVFEYAMDELGFDVWTADAFQLGYESREDGKYDPAYLE